MLRYKMKVTALEIEANLKFFTIIVRNLLLFSILKISNYPQVFIHPIYYDKKKSKEQRREIPRDVSDFFLLGVSF